MLDLKSLTPWGHKSNVPAKPEESSDPFVSFRREVDRVFDNFFNDFTGLIPRSSSRTDVGWLSATPRIDVDENDKELVVSAELPGVDEKDFQVTLTGDVLTIKGEKKYEHEEKEGERHYVERRFGSFTRSVRLPFEAAEQETKADFDKGVLTIRIAKPAEVRSKVKQIEVRTH